MASGAKTVEQYLAALPADRRAALEAIRKLVRRNLPRGFEEGIKYGTIGYYVPLARYPETYNGQPLCAVGLASQKHHMSLYLMSVYANPELSRWFLQAYKKSGKRLDMGKSCLRFRSVDELALDVVAKVLKKTSVAEFISRYEASRRGRRTPKKPRK